MRRTARSLSLFGLALAVVLIAAACVGEEDTPVPEGAGPSAAGPAASEAVASAAPSFTIATANDPKLGAYLTGAGGMTLYVLARDPAGLSTCSLDCAKTWPPLEAALGAKIPAPAGATGTLSTLTRSDGKVQVTYNDMPLYYFSGDSAAGDTKGQAKDGVWYVAPVSGTKPTPAAGAATPVPPSNPLGGSSAAPVPSGY
ncbi:MAG: COG4315 family predicted lipoprotein [Candidatus Limnocylindrales bacterium]